MSPILSGLGYFDYIYILLKTYNIHIMINWTTTFDKLDSLAIESQEVISLEIDDNEENEYCCTKPYLVKFIDTEFNCEDFTKARWVPILNSWIDMETFKIQHITGWYDMNVELQKI